MTPETAQYLLFVLRMYLPILERAENRPEILNELVCGTGVATMNAYRKAIEQATKEIEK